MKIFLIRHGESIQNTKENYSLRLPDHKVYLSEKGKVQAHDAGKFLKKYVRENKGIKISREISKLSLEIDRYQLRFWQQTERFATVRELSIHFQKSELEIVQAMNSKNALQSIDTPIVEDGKEMNLYDITPSPRKQNIEELLDLKDALLNLEQDERELICNRYYKDMSQTELASMTGMSQVQISRKEHKILKKLNHMMH